MLLRAENIPVEPDPDNAGVGKFTEHLKDVSVFFVFTAENAEKNFNFNNKNLCLFALVRG